MRLQKLFVLGLLALFIGSGSAFAALTGVIAGKCTDADGNPVPGVTVTITGANLPGARVDTTSAQGAYRMPELPPGVYGLTAELMGMQKVEFKDIKVSVNATATVNFTMEMQKFEKELVVIGAAPVLDTKSVTVKTTIERDVTERLPGSDDLFTAFSMAGGINGSGNVRVHGAANTDNLYLFDGVDTTDPVTSTFGANLNADAIQEVEVQTGGFQAEYGRARGGIVNAVTKSGGNDFHGILRVKFNNSDWGSDSKHDIAQNTYDYYEPTLTLEGPILKDKLWFMITYQYSNNDGTTQTLREYGFDPLDPANLTDQKTDREFNLPYGKVTYQLNQEHKLVFNYSGEDATIHGNGGGLQNTPETYQKQEQGGPFYSLEWTWLYSPNLFFIARAGAMYGKLNYLPEEKTATDPRDASFFDTYWRQFYNNAATWTEENRDRMQFGLTASYFVEDLMGSHEFKSGFEFHDLNYEQFAADPGGASYRITQIPVGDPDHPDSYYGSEATRTSLMFPGTSSFTGQYLSFYLQDTWSILENLTLNLGFRYEMSEFADDTGSSQVPAWTWGWFDVSDYKNADGSYKQMAELKFDDMLAPRLGINWDLTGDGRTSLNAYYGRFYNPFDLSLHILFQPFEVDTTATRQQEYTGPEWHDADRDGLPDEDYFFDDSNWKTTGESSATARNMFDPNIKAEYQDQYVVGLEREIMQNFSLSLNYTHNQTNDMLEDTGLFVDEAGNVVWTYRGGITDGALDPNKNYDPREESRDYPGDYSQHLYYVTNAAGNTRKYDGVELNATARLKNFDLQASYTYSKAEGSVTEGQPGSDGIAQFSVYYDTYSLSDKNIYGELPWSVSQYLKLAGSFHYDITDWYEFSIGVNGFLRTGYKYSKMAVPPKTYNPDDPTNDFNDRSTWTGRPPYNTTAAYMPEGRGSYEYPSFYNIDLSLQNSFKFGKFGTLTAILDVNNITDYQGIVQVDDVFNPKFPDAFGQPTGFGTPRNYTLSLKYAF